MKEKEGTQRIRPSLQSRQVNFIFFAAVRAFTQSNPAHDNKTSAPANSQRTPSCCCCLFNFEHFRKKNLTHPLTLFPHQSGVNHRLSHARPSDGKGIF
jgi:hypothetical protein